MPRMKIIVIGDQAVGKSSLLQKFITGGFNQLIASTYSLDYFSQTLEYKGQEILLSIWDTVGQEKFANLSKNYYQKSDGVIIVMDATKPMIDNLSNLKKHLQRHEEVNKSCKKIIVLLNKIDLVDDQRLQKQLQDNQEEIKSLQKYFKFQGIQKISVKLSSHDNIRSIFFNLAKTIFDKLVESESKTQASTYLIPPSSKIEKPNPSNSCC